MAQQRNETAQQQRDTTARRDYEQLRSRNDFPQAGPWSRAFEEAARVNLDLSTEALRAWQGVTRANLKLVSETMRAWLSLFGLQRRS